MATPRGAGRKWRFRLNDASTLEVSSPLRATEKQVRRRGRWSLIVGTLIAALAVVAVALADNAVADGDGVTPVTNQDMAFGNVNCGVATSKTALIAISRQGAVNNNVFNNSATVTVSVTAVTGAGLSAASPVATITLPANWQLLANNTLSDAVSSLVTVNSSTPGAGAGSVTYTATGLGGTSGTVAVERSDSMAVSWTVLDNCTPPDTTPPEISYVLNPASSDGTNGWYKSSVTLTWTVTENESPSSLVETGCIDQNITADQQEQTYSCSATSDGGSAGPVEVKIKRDATAPVITPNASADSCSAPGDNGWCRGTQTAGFTATDATSGIAPTGTSPVNFTQNTTTNGSAVNISSGTKFDMAGNESNAIDAGPFKIDSLKPLNSVTGVANGQTYTLGSVPAAGCDTTDQGTDNSGVAEASTLSVTGGTVNGVGTFEAKCMGGKDNAGNTADIAMVTYYVIYGGLSGILQPIDPNNSSLFSRGRAVPVKFQLAGDEYTGFDYSGWSLARQKVSCTEFSSDGDPVEAVTENPSNAFRYDATADQYINNASFKDQPAGTCWKVVVTLDSGQKLTSAIFKLQK